MKSQGLTVRAANEGDATAVAATYAPYVWGTPVSFEVEAPTDVMMAQRIGTTLTTHPWLVAELNGAVVGFACAGKHSPRAAYRWTVDVTVYVSMREQRSGVGRSLYRVLLETLRRQGFRSAFAEIVLPNPGSIRLHEAMGFQHIGIHKDIGSKLAKWRDIGYWRLGLADGIEAPQEPIPFISFQNAPAFVELLALAG